MILFFIPKVNNPRAALARSVQRKKPDGICLRLFIFSCPGSVFYAKTVYDRNDQAAYIILRCPVRRDP